MHLWLILKMSDAETVVFRENPVNPLAMDIVGPVLLQWTDPVAIISANGSAVLSCAPTVKSITTTSYRSIVTQGLGFFTSPHYPQPSQWIYSWAIKPRCWFAERTSTAKLIH